MGRLRLRDPAQYPLRHPEYTDAGILDAVARGGTDRGVPALFAHRRDGAQGRSRCRARAVLRIGEMQSMSYVRRARWTAGTRSESASKRQTKRRSAAGDRESG